MIARVRTFMAFAIASALCQCFPAIAEPPRLPGLSDVLDVRGAWGTHNLTYLETGSPCGPTLRVALQAGGIDPASMRKLGRAESGAGFKTTSFSGGARRAVLGYCVRFPEDFAFVRGGKLPGLFGGRGNSGGVIPNGHDGFSFRLMWLEDGWAQIYAYLPDSREFGTPLLARRFRFVPGAWHRLLQEIVLNEPGRSNGSARLWLDGRLVGEVADLRIRDTDRLRIDGVFFDVFFGGHDATWAPPKDSHIDFAGFSVTGN